MKDWQAYTASGQPIVGVGTNRDEAFAKGIPHAAAHIWVWKEEGGATHLLFQKCTPKVAYKAGLLDISAAGHVDLGEDEIAAAIREAEEELGLKITSASLYFAGVEHYQRKMKESHKDELRFIYVIKYDKGMDFTFPDGEVEGVEWIRAGGSEDIVSRDDFKERFVQHTSYYFDIVFSGINGQKLLTNS